MANQPDVGDVHVNALLTNLSVAYLQDESTFIADNVFPTIMVDKQSDVYAKYDKGAWYRDHGDRMLRAPGTRAGRTGYTVDMSSTYRTINYAIGTGIPDELRYNADAVFQLDSDATRLVTGLQLIRRERAFVADFMKTGVWTTDKTGGSSFTKFSDYANSDPFSIIDDYIQLVRVLIGRKPNKLVMGELVWRRLKHHPDFLDRIKGGATPGQPAIMTKALFSQWFEGLEILVGESVYNNADEGSADNLETIWSDDMLLLYTPSAPSLLTPAAGYTFVWRPAVNGGAIQFIRKYREDPEKQDVVEAHSYFDQAVCAPDAGLFFSDAVD
jgi:hypothetical protein